MGAMSSPTSGTPYSERPPKHPGGLGRLNGAPATSVPDANQLGRGGTGGDKPSITLVASASTKHHLAGACREFLHSLKKFHEVRTKDLEVSLISMSVQRILSLVILTSTS